jgi:hypothetical protein
MVLVQSTAIIMILLGLRRIQKHYSHGIWPSDINKLREISTNNGTKLINPKYAVLFNRFLIGFGLLYTITNRDLIWELTQDRIPEVSIDTSSLIGNQGLEIVRLLVQFFTGTDYEAIQSVGFSNLIDFFLGLLFIAVVIYTAGVAGYLLLLQLKIQHYQSSDGVRTISPLQSIIGQYMIYGSIIKRFQYNRARFLLIVVMLSFCTIGLLSMFFGTLVLIQTI